MKGTEFNLENSIEFCVLCHGRVIILSDTCHIFKNTWKRWLWIFYCKVMVFEMINKCIILIGHYTTHTGINIPPHPINMHSCFVNQRKKSCIGFALVSHTLFPTYPEVLVNFSESLEEAVFSSSPSSAFFLFPCISNPPPPLPLLSPPPPPPLLAPSHSCSFSSSFTFFF